METTQAMNLRYANFFYPSFWIEGKSIVESCGDLPNQLFPDSVLQKLFGINLDHSNQGGLHCKQTLSED